MFELKFTYHSRSEEGSYDTSETKEMKKKLGNFQSEEPVSYEKLASTIMAQMARRDIWVIDVKVREYVAKEIAVKETKNGIVIGNRKYSFDDVGSISFTEEKPAAPIQLPPVQVNPSSNPISPFIPQQLTLPPRGSEISIPEHMIKKGDLNLADLHLLRMKPLRYETFHPDPEFIPMQQYKGLPFTVGNKYPIYEEKPAGSNIQLGMKYTTIDNNGQKQILSDKHFMQVGVLIGGDLFTERNDVPIPYGRTEENKMPVLR